MTLHPQFITDTKGKVVSAILPIYEFKNILEDLEDVRLYDEAKKND